MDTLQKTFSFSPSFRIDVLCVNDTDCIDNVNYVSGSKDQTFELKIPEYQSKLFIKPSPLMVIN